VTFHENINVQRSLDISAVAVRFDFFLGCSSSFVGKNKNFVIGNTDFSFTVTVFGKHLKGSIVEIGIQGLENFLWRSIISGCTGGLLQR
jgi:hypothetical protein